MTEFLEVIAKNLNKPTMTIEILFHPQNVRLFSHLDNIRVRQDLHSAPQSALLSRALYIRRFQLKYCWSHFSIKSKATLRIKGSTISSSQNIYPWRSECLSQVGWA